LTCCNSFRKVYYLELSLRVACKEWELLCILAWQLLFYLFTFF
jgi:hypothetical protein